MAEGQYDNPLYVECANFAPSLTGEEMCRAFGPHVLAVMPNGRDTWEVHVTTGEIRESLEVEGLTLRGRHCEVSRIFSGGTWVRIRRLPLNMLYVEKVWGSGGRGQALHVAKHVHKNWRPDPQD